MIEDKKLWEKIFYIHSYFLNCEFSYNFVNTVFNNYNFEGNSDIFNFYYYITQKYIPNSIDLTRSSYKKINFLLLDNFRVDSLFPISEFENLIYLTANQNKIDSLVPIAKFKNIEFLNLHSNKISNLEPIRNFKELRHLDLAANSIFETSELGTCSNLNYLNLCANKISYLSGFGDLHHLEELGIGNNSINSLNPLYNLYNLRKLDIRFNPLSEDELVRIKKALPDCIIKFHYNYPEDRMGQGREVELVLHSGMVFMFYHFFDQYRNRSYYWIRFIDSVINGTIDNPKDFMKKLIEKYVANVLNFDEKIYASNNDLEISCQINYKFT